MKPITPKKPVAEANRLSILLNVSLGKERFPVDVTQLAMDYAQQFGHDDGISDVVGEDLPGFEGALYRVDEGDKPKWALLYNSAIEVPGRIRFTIAHELGHYILHREGRDAFECSQEDMLYWESNERRIESEADTFASYLLMPLDDYRIQIREDVADLTMLESCASRYGVSLTAATLKWLEFTTQRAVLVMSRDGYVLWARSSESALRTGAFFRTKNATIPIPACSLAASKSALVGDRHGVVMSAKIWFDNEPMSMSLREICITSDRYDQTMSLLILPRAEHQWTQDSDDEERPMLDSQIQSGHFPKR
jgi:hypothetical protein